MDYVIAFLLLGIFGVELYRLIEHLKEKKIQKSETFKFKR